MQFGIYGTGTDSAGSRRASTVGGGRLSRKNYRDAAQTDNSLWMQVSSSIQEIAGEAGKEAEKSGTAGTVKNLSIVGPEEENAGAKKAEGGKRSEAAKIYEAATAGKENPIGRMRTAPKVPYGHLAKDGVIEYNGVVFVCDERTNSICLGNVEDRSQVITVALSGGGHLKVNRNNIGDLSKAVGMFSPEDLNLIMRAIAQDTKIQSVKKEIDDMENSIGSAENAISGECAPEDTASEEEALEENAPEGVITEDTKNKKK